VSARDIGKKTVPMVPAPRQRPSQSNPPPPVAEPRVVVNASLLDDVEINAELPPGVEVWTPGGVRRTKPMIPSKVDLWTPDGVKGPRPGSTSNATRAATLKNLPQQRAQAATMLLPVAKRRNRHKSVAALSVAAFIAALAMLGGVLAWRHWRKTPAPLVREPPTRADKSDVA
jgi:hypothetical protein